MIREFQMGAEGGGGFVMWFLLICAVIGVAILIERLYSLFIRARLNPRAFFDKLIKVTDAQGVKGGIALCNNTAAPVAKVLKAVLEKAD